MEKQRRCLTPEKDLSGIRWPFLTEGLSKVDVSAKNYFLGRDPDTIVFLQPSVSRRREATFWIIGPLLLNPFRRFLQNHRKGSQILTSRNSPDNSADSADSDKVVSASVPRDLPSTRAGGQDDVSLNKLPQIRRPQRGHQAWDVMCPPPLLLSSPWAAGCARTDLPPH